MGSNYYDFTFDHPHPYPGSSYNNGAGPSTLPPPYSIQRPFMPAAQEEPRAHEPPPALTGDPAFDILDWHPAYQSCQRFFLDHAQHEQATQALCALINIRLPFQYLQHPTTSSDPGGSGATSSNRNLPYPRQSGSSASLTPDSRRHGNSSHQPSPPVFVSLIPYLRRLIVTGFDKPPILHGFFGDDYTRGILPHLDCERRNYLFAAKHGGWRCCKKQYDIGSGVGGDESVPFMKPLDQAKMEELTAAEKAWSGWLAMEDWMVGPRAPEDGEDGRSTRSGGAAMHPERENLPDGVPEAFAGD